MIWRPPLRGRAGAASPREEVTRQTARTLQHLTECPLKHDLTAAFTRAGADFNNLVGGSDQ